VEKYRNPRATEGESIFPVDLTEWYCQYQQTDTDTENHRSVERKTYNDVTDKSNWRQFIRSQHRISQVSEVVLLDSPAIVVIMSVSTFMTVDILCVKHLHTDQVWMQEFM